MAGLRVLCVVIVVLAAGCEHLRTARVDPAVYVAPGYDGPGRVVGVLDASSGALTDMDRFAHGEVPAAIQDMRATTMVALSHGHEFNARRDGSYKDAFTALSLKSVLIGPAPVVGTQAVPGSTAGAAHAPEPASTKNTPPEAKNPAPSGTPHASAKPIASPKNGGGK